MNVLVLACSPEPWTSWTDKHPFLNRTTVSFTDSLLQLTSALMPPPDAIVVQLSAANPWSPEELIERLRAVVPFVPVLLIADQSAMSRLTLFDGCNRTFFLVPDRCDMNQYQDQLMACMSARAQQDLDTPKVITLWLLMRASERRRLVHHMLCRSNTTDRLWAVLDPELAVIATPSKHSENYVSPQSSLLVELAGGHLASLMETWKTKGRHIVLLPTPHVGDPLSEQCLRCCHQVTAIDPIEPSPWADYQLSLLSRLPIRLKTLHLRSEQSSRLHIPLINGFLSFPRRHRILTEALLDEQLQTKD